MDQGKILSNKHIRSRVLFILISIALMVVVVGILYSSRSRLVDHGKVDLTDFNFNKSKYVQLNGQWEFYWNKLLSPQDFSNTKLSIKDSFINVPGTWDKEKSGTHYNPKNGVATYRLLLKYPLKLKDPALRIQHIATAYRLYVNGRLVAGVGKVSKNKLEFKEGEKLVIVRLPTDTQELEIIFQVANLNYAGSGIMLSPIFGSEELLKRQNVLILTQQVFVIGCVFIFGIYYFLLFFLQRKNKTAFVFSILCFITALRSSIWGEYPITIFFPNMKFDTCLFINYLTGYNIIPIVILFILSFYPLENKKNISKTILLPSVVFDLLLLTPPAFISRFSNILYILVLIQMMFGMIVLINAVLHKRDYSFVLFAAICIYNLTIIQDILLYKGIGGVNLSYMSLYGNFVVIIAMSYVQAKQQADMHKKLLIYNEKLIEADKLRDKIEATEMSFLQAQIKPHFLYNALNAIANISEKDGRKASNLIINLALYLRQSLEFNTLYKMTTLGKELEFVDNYFSIERARFGEKIKLIKEIGVSFDYQIPILILQPIVENAIRHGISKKLNGGTVIIRVLEEKEHISIVIEDDGVGIAGEKLDILLDDEKRGNGVGLINIHHRLLKIYGTGLDINCKEGQGTSVKILLPKKG